MNHKSMPERNHFKRKKIFCNHPVQTKQKNCIAGHIHRTQNKMKKQLSTIEQSCCWNYLNWNYGYFQVVMVWIFLCLFFTKSAEQCLETDNIVR